MIYQQVQETTGVQKRLVHFIFSGKCLRITGRNLHFSEGDFFDNGAENFS